MTLPSVEMCLCPTEKKNHYEDSMMNVATGAKGANELNSYSVLENRVATCNGKKRPNIFSVKHWDKGDVLDFVKGLNTGDTEFLGGG